MSGRGATDRRTRVRDYVESSVIAVVMALLLKQFLIEAYRIPTGSMQPTLIGSDAADVHDRILVDKVSYWLRDPERWEIAVFRYPLERSKSFVKRVVGLPGEQIRIQDGDLWRRGDSTEPWTLLRRPRGVQRETWKRLDALEPERARWRPSGGAAEWELEGRSIRARGDGKVRFGHSSGSIMDDYSDGYPDSIADAVAREFHGGGIEPVGDLRVAGRVRALAGCALVQVQLDEGTLRYSFDLPGPAAPADSRPRIRVTELGSGEPREVASAAAEPRRLRAGASVAFGAQNLDDLLELELDGEVVAALEIEPRTTQAARASAAHLVVHGEGADLDDIMVWRDIYYLPIVANEVTVPAGHYYVLGDNTQDSSDSREWTVTRYDVADGAGGTRRIEGNWRRGSWSEGANPYKDLGDPAGTVIWLRDVHGEQHVFREADSTPRGTEKMPFVERSLIQGRALAVFWPLRPLSGLYRLKWVR